MPNDTLNVSVDGMKAAAIKLGALEYQSWVLRQIELVALMHPHSMAGMLELSKRIAAHAGIPFPNELEAPDAR